MFNNTIQDIKKSITVTHAKGDHRVEIYDFKIQVGENEFKFEDVAYDTPDIVMMNGDDISIENLSDMFFKVDGEFMALGDIMRQCTEKAYLEAEEWLACDRLEYAMERSHIEEVSSPRLTGRI